MSLLRVYRDDSNTSSSDEYSRFEDIARMCAEAGIQFERWTAAREIANSASSEEILAAYRAEVQTLRDTRGFVQVDVVSISADHPQRVELRNKFLNEHTHSEDEVRFFVAGSGWFCIHHASAVYALFCERGDLVSVPAGTRHWFDMGPRPSFTCIRLFNDPAGWIAEFTGSDISQRFPLAGD